MSYLPRKYNIFAAFAELARTRGISSYTVKAGGIKYHVTQPEINPKIELGTMGVRCPSERPYCVVQNYKTICIASSSASGNRRVNRLSRPPLASPQQQQHRQQQQQQQQQQTQVNDGTGPSGDLFTDPQVTITLKGQNSLDVPNNNPSAPLPPLHITQPSEEGSAPPSAPGQSGNRAGTGRLASGSTNSGTGGGPPFRNRFSSGFGSPFSSGIFSKSNNINSGNNNINRGGPFSQEVQNVAPDFCFLRPQPGRCRGYLSRYYFNPETGQCQSFRYKGCGGNANRFETLVDCFKVCALPHGAIGSSPSVFGNARVGGPTPTNIPTPLTKPYENGIQRGNALGNSNINDNVNSINTNTNINEQTDAIFGNNRFFSDPAGGLSQVLDNSVNENQKTGNDKFRQTDQGGQISTTGQHERQRGTLPRACYLDVDVGQCQGSLTRVYFNRNTGRCEIFDFGGCGGNANNFLNFPDCNKACGLNTRRRAQKPVDPPLESDSQLGIVTSGLSNSQSRANSPRITNLLDDNDMFNSANSNLNIMNGNSRNRNNFINVDSIGNNGAATTVNVPALPRERQNQLFQSPSSRRSRLRPETCYQPASAGPCLAAFSRYYYNKTEDQCLAFIYGGCGGNQNNYASRQDCARDCGGGEEYSAVQQDVGGDAGNTNSDVFSRSNSDISLGKDYVEQNSSFRRDGLNSGLSGGTVGNIIIGDGNQQQQSLQSSQQNKIGSGNRCMIGADRGPCSEQIMRYYYNSQAGQCQAFSYGGCQGNANNFPSLVACASACDGFGGFPSPSPPARTTNRRLGNYAGNVNRPRVCELEPFPGPCRAFIPRIYFNRRTGRCEQFIYGGCQSNGNNFQSSSECIRVCSGDGSSSPRADNTNSRRSIGVSRSSRDRFSIMADPLPFSTFRFNEDEARMF
ncbi:papilin [Elysia marginata]|uniref:Papilin n=1 Tax=Elysia marginata TaxID=1093978 RepID=A0AAV4F3J1_9GAST|nr:papilin [Elysia marginata]